MPIFNKCAKCGGEYQRTFHSYYCDDCRGTGFPFKPLSPSENKRLIYDISKILDNFIIARGLRVATGNWDVPESQEKSSHEENPRDDDQLTTR